MQLLLVYSLLYSDTEYSLGEKAQEIQNLLNYTHMMHELCPACP